MLSMKLFHMHLHQNDDERINNNYFCKIIYLIFITYQNHVTWSFNNYYSQETNESNNIS